MTKARPVLLDVNVLIALFDADHVHRDIAHDWFADNRAARWATCAIIENGFLRVLTNPGSPIEEDRSTIFRSLGTLCSSPDHVFWDDTISLRDESIFDSSILVSHKQLTDVYLLGLAIRMKGRLATFDGRVPVKAVKGATANSLIVLAA